MIGQKEEYGENQFNVYAHYTHANGSGEYMKMFALHPIYKGEYEKRMKAVQSADPRDNALSWGCINIPEDVLLKLTEYIGENENNTRLFVTPDMVQGKEPVFHIRDTPSFVVTSQ
jgi:hypothetical protein